LLSARPLRASFSAPPPTTDIATLSLHDALPIAFLGIDPDRQTPVDTGVATQWAGRANVELVSTLPDVVRQRRDRRERELRAGVRLGVDGIGPCLVDQDRDGACFRGRETSLGFR